MLLRLGIHSRKPENCFFHGGISQEPTKWKPRWWASAIRKRPNVPSIHWWLGQLPYLTSSFEIDWDQSIHPTHLTLHFHMANMNSIDAFFDMVGMMNHPIQDMTKPLKIQPLQYDSGHGTLAGHSLVEATHLQALLWMIRFPREATQFCDDSPNSTNASKPRLDSNHFKPVVSFQWKHTTFRYFLPFNVMICYLFHLSPM